MKFKKVILIVVLIAIIGILIIAGFSFGKNKEESKSKYKITVSNFASYDFLRAIIGDNEDIELKFLLGPGKDSHSYDPTAQDLITIQKSDVFVYVGGEMESWSDRVLSTLDTSTTKVICIADDIDTIEEKEVDGAEEHDHEHDEDEIHEDHDHDEHEEEAHEEHHHEEGAFDEHIWTSPKNAIAMVNALEKVMEELDSQNAAKYKENSEKYIEKINDVDTKIQKIIDSKKRDRLLFGDKMPMQYFIDYYNLEVSAAFSGCSTETEPSSKTIAYLVEKAKSENIPVILYIELNTGKVAETIANEVGNACKAMQIQTLHNVTKQDFENGETWVTLMTRNIDVLKAALQ